MICRVELKLFKYTVIHRKDDYVLPESLLGYKLIRYQPKLFKLSAYQQNPFLVLFWMIVSLGRSEIFLLLDNDVIVHSSYVSPKVYRFPFMNKNDIQIGPCATNPNYQKKGIYTQMLLLLQNIYSNKERTIWIYTNLKNTASQKAILKSGFEFFGIVKMSKLTKIIHLKKNDE